jgi:Flp pilus assembly pilin Flp
MNLPTTADAEGQSSIEYLVVLAFCVLVVVAVSVESSPFHELILAIKSFFSAYSFAISLTP